MVFHLKEKGFTLIELLIVIAIIGLLSSVVLASLSSARTKSRDSKRLEDMKQLQLAIEMYADDNGGVYPTKATFQLYGGAYGDTRYVQTCSKNTLWDSELGPLLKPYMSKVPRDPSGNEIWPYCYYYFPEGIPNCAGSAPVGSTYRYALIFTTEQIRYDLPKVGGGADGRYCITP